MIVQIIIITIGFFIALSYPMGFEPLWFFPADSASAITPAVIIILSSALYVLAGFRLVRQQIRQNLKDYYRRVASYRLLLLFIYFAQVYIFHIPALIDGLGAGGIPFVTRFLGLCPFLLTLILSYIPFYKVERFIYQQSNRETSNLPSLFNFLSFQIRTYFLLGVLPLLLFILVFDIIHSIPPVYDAIRIYPFLEWITFIGLLLALYIFTPFALKYLWVTKPLPDGPLRIYLDAIAFRAGIKIRDFLVWQVGERPFVNALLIGLFPFNRFVIFTDSIIKNLPDDEIAAVFSHEVGHAKFNHLPILLLFTLVYLGILFSLSGAIDSVLGSGFLNFGFSLTLIMAFWLALFGQLSRRFELQADWFAAHITADPESFTRALTKIAYLNGIPMRTSGLSTLTHPSIERRITNIANREGFAQSQLRTMKRIAAILAIGCGLCLAGVGYTIAQEVKTAPERRLQVWASHLAEQAHRLLLDVEKQKESPASMAAFGEPRLASAEAERAEGREKLLQAISYIDTALQYEDKEPLYYILLGDALEMLSPEYLSKSQRCYEKARELGPIYPGLRYYLEKKMSVK
ncbi:MAG: M48 family metallopeptidase [Planctomycetota bacterium]